MDDSSLPSSSITEGEDNHSLCDNAHAETHADMSANNEKSQDSEAIEAGQGAAKGQIQFGTDQDKGEGERDAREQSISSVVKHRWWKFKMRGFDDDLERDWWFASTAIPLLAATIAPLANVTSIAALVTYWREDLSDGNGGIVSQLDGVPFPDPRWCYWLNVASLICGFVGNMFLLFNFTSRVRYIIALPMTILFFYLATAILVAITVAMHVYQAPVVHFQTYTQGYWYAVTSAVLYFISAQLLMVNMLGYCLGHYPQQFDLTDSQRTLILQTMLFFIWLAGGAAVFSAVENDQSWAFVDALYFCDVTILTVGFGDLYPTNDTGRGLVFPYSVGGIITLGLVISSIANFVGELSEDKVIKKHVEKSRHRTVSRAISEPEEIKKIVSRRDAVMTAGGRAVRISQPANASKITNIGPGGGLAAYNRNDHDEIMRMRRRSSSAGGPSKFPKRVMSMDAAISRTKNTMSKRMYILRDERDRFDIMRRIQRKTAKFKRWYALCISITAFAVLWVCGAIVFWQCEKGVQGMTYFQALYFCYVSLLTIGYGDLAPKSNGGRCFFVVWSLIAVPTMTILINDLGSTVISSFKQGTFRFAEFTLLPKKGVWREIVESSPKIYGYLQRRKERLESKKRLKEGMKYPGEPGGEALDPDLEREAAALHPDVSTLERETAQDIKNRKPVDSSEVLARRLAVAIRTVAGDLTTDPHKHYSFEQWAEITRLIRFTLFGQDAAVIQEENDEVLEWDWLGENSPMMVGQTEPEFVLDRLCESLGRYMRRVEQVKQKHNIGDSMDLDSTEAAGAGRAKKEKGAHTADSPAVTKEGKTAAIGKDHGSRVGRASSSKNNATSRSA